VTGALAGVKVVDLTRVLAGPLATMMLGDMGADVIKVEQPGLGDIYRQTGSIYVKGESVNYLSTNRNKRSITVDLGTDGGRAIVTELVRDADVLVENFRPGVMDRLGIGYEHLRELNPRLVYCSVSGFGSTGPDRDRTAVDPIIQAESGVMSLTGEIGGDPVRVGTAVGDIYGAMLAVQGVLLALLARGGSGEGQKVEVALLDAAIFGLIPREGEYFATGEVFPRMGTTHPQVVPFGVFQASDAPLFIAAFHDGLWRKLCEGLDRPDIAEDDRFRTGRDRVEHRDQLTAIISPLVAERSSADLLETLVGLGVPVAPINDIADVFRSPQVIHNQMVVEMEHPIAGPIRMLNNPVRMSVNRAEMRLPPPTLGQHTDEVLGELSYDAAAIARFREEGAV
jgi:formyl-CoA transferase